MQLAHSRMLLWHSNIRWGRFGKTFWHRREHRPALAILWKEGELEFFVAGKKHVMNNFGIAKRWANHLGTRKKNIGTCNNYHLGFWGLGQGDLGFRGRGLRATLSVLVAETSP